MKKLSIRATALALAILLGASPAVSASQALGTELHMGRTQLAEGVSYTRQYLWSATYSDLRTERYIEYTPNALVQPVVAYGDSIPAKSTLTELARALQADGKRVIGGVNGDYFVVATGAPLGMVVTDGVLRSSSSYHHALGFDADGNAFIGRPDLSMTATFRDHSYTIAGGLNKVRTATGGFTLYSRDFGPTTRHTEPGVDVILSPKTDKLGQQVEVVLSVDTAASQPEQPLPTPSDPAEQDTPEAPQPVPNPSDPDTALPPEDTQETPSTKQIRDTLVYRDVPVIGGRMECVVEQVLHSDRSIDIPEGKLVLSLHKDSHEWLMSELSALQPGDTVEIDITSPDPQWKSARTAIGGLYKMVTNGEVETGLDSGQAPRTAIGIRPDGSMLFYTVDGRQSGYSVGASMTQAARRLIELGCTEAVCMDGGGSTTLGATLPGDEGFGILNRPSEGKPRAISNALFLVAQQTAPGPVASLTVTPGDSLLLSGQSVALSAVGVDAIGQRVKTYDAAALNFTAPAGAGTLHDGTFTAGTTAGIFPIQATADGHTATAMLRVIPTPDRITLKNADTGAAVSALTLTPGASISLDAQALYRNLPLLCHDELFTWSVDQALGNIDQSGNFTSNTVAGTGAITVTAGEYTLRVPVSLAARISTVESFEGDFSNMADSMTATVVPERSAAYVRFGTQSARITYNSSETEYAAVSIPMQFSPDDAFLSFWVYGDGSGNTLSALVRTQDESSVEQILAVLNFTGWQQITTPLPLNATEVSVLKITPTGTTEQGVIRLDQVTASDRYATDAVPPSATLQMDEMGLTATLYDNADTRFSEQQVSVTYDGQPLEATLDGLTLTTPLPELDGKAHRITVTVTDASGNIGRSCYDIPADPSAPTPFADTTGHWAESYVNYLYDQGVSNGVVSGEQLLFQPDKQITRGEFALMAARWLRLDLTQYSTVQLPFADADSIPAWALDGVKAMYALGILQGSAGAGDSLYAYAERSITRAEAMTMLGRIQPKGHATTELTFSDARDVPTWAADYVSTLVAQGVINGYVNNTIAPNECILRCEMAKILYAMR